MQITEPNRFIECIIAPGFSEAALAAADDPADAGRRASGCLRTGPLRPRRRPARLDFRRVDGGLLVQTRDLRRPTISRKLKVVTKRQPTDAELADLRFAWLVCKHVKSNAIVLAKGGMVVGVGAGQMSRVDSVHMAVRKAGERAQRLGAGVGCVLPVPRQRRRGGRGRA